MDDDEDVVNRHDMHLAQAQREDILRRLNTLEIRQVDMFNSLAGMRHEVTEMILLMHMGRGMVKLIMVVGIVGTGLAGIFSWLSSQFQWFTK